MRLLEKHFSVSFFIPLIYPIEMYCSNLSFSKGGNLTVLVQSELKLSNFFESALWGATSSCFPESKGAKSCAFKSVSPPL